MVAGLPTPKFQIAVLISGGGTTLKNLITHIDEGKLPVEIALVVSSNPNAAGIAFADKNNIPVRTATKTKSLTDAQYCEQVFGPIRETGVDLVVMGGFLKHVLIPDDFTERVINIHPSLIPAFAGQGYYGLRVHQAVIAKGCRVSGCTVHYVDNEFDHGPIIAQRAVDVSANDNAETLQKKVFKVECELLPDVIRQIAEASAQVG